MADSAAAGRAGPGSSRVLPDPAICRTRPMKKTHSFAECLVDHPDSCPFVILTPKAQLCTHPNFNEFVKT